MATKSRKYSIARFILFVLVVTFFSSFLVSTLNTVDMNRNEDILNVGSYYESKEIFNDLYKKVDPVTEYIAVYKNVDEIKSGKFLKNPESDYSRKKEEIFNEYLIENKLEYIDEQKSQDILVDFNRKYAKKLKGLREDEIAKRLNDYKKLEERLTSIPKEEYLIYGTNGENTISNFGYNIDEIRKNKVYIIITRDGLESSEAINPAIGYQIFSSVSGPLIDSIGYRENQNRVYVAMNDSYLTERLNQWNRSSADSKEGLKDMTIYGSLTIMAFIALGVFAGKDENGNLKMRSIDRLYTDINIVLCIAVIFLYVVAIAFLYERVGYRDFSVENLPLVAITTTLSTIGLTLVMSLLRHIKNGSFIKHSLIYSLVYRLVDMVSKFVRTIYNNRSLGMKLAIQVVIYTAIVFLSSLILPQGLVIIILSILWILWRTVKKIEAFENIKKGVKSIREGDLSHNIYVESSGEFMDLAEDINEIGEGLRNAVDNELKSERHRSELITNISHDIRTPLTSIITYIDLLKYEQDPAKSQEYIAILDKKAERLKQLTDNLFEASKLNSGDIPVKLTDINLSSLITQGLGELYDDIVEKNLDFVYDIPEDIHIMADGDLMWRAINNIFSNIFKYGLEGSRVYIDIIERERTVMVNIKNISKYELNISEAELMERFKRGDESRTSEGSGLGLSIVDSLISLQGGKFSIEIDGDLFKSIIEMPKIKSEED